MAEIKRSTLFGKLNALGYKNGDMPHSEAAALETLALPIYPELSEDQIRYVAATVKEFVEQA